MIDYDLLDASYHEKIAKFTYPNIKGISGILMCTSKVDNTPYEKGIYAPKCVLAGNQTRFVLPGNKLTINYQNTKKVFGYVTKVHYERTRKHTIVEVDAWIEQ